MMVKVTQIRTPEQQARDFLANLPDEQLGCMSQRHPWPLIDPRKRQLPNGISARPQHDGCYQIEETCPNCGKVRWYTTLPGGVFDVNVIYRYRDPQGWVTKHDDVEATRRDYKAELFRRASEQLTGLIRAADEPQDEPPAGTLKPARFTAPGA
jgi:hypothetical protein